MKFQVNKVESRRIANSARVIDPYIDRRCGDDRREVYDSDYFENAGLERRRKKDRRKEEERRAGCVKSGKWTSVCPDDI